MVTWSKTYSRMLVVLSAFILLYGCSGLGPVKIEPIPPTDNPTEHLTVLKKSLDEGHSAQLNLLAPDSFAEAVRNYDNAKSGIDEGGNLAFIMDSIANSRAYLVRASESAQLARTALPDLIEERSNARAAGAPALEKEYAAAEERFLELTRAVEANDMKTVQRRKESVTEAYHNVKLKAIKSRYIGEVRKLISQAESDGARKYAPETLASANRALAEADAFISENPYEKEAMIEKASAALFEAQRLTNINHRIRDYREMEPEQIALSVEGMFKKVTDQLAAPDMRNEPFEIQVDNIVGSTAALQDDRRYLSGSQKDLQAEVAELKRSHSAEVQKLRADYQSEITTLNTKYKSELVASGMKQLEVDKLEAEDRVKAEKLAALERFEAEKQAALVKLEAEKRFNSLFLEMQDIFGKKEAEVYRKGNQLVIRLKEIRFPVGEAIIMPDNYQLLSKVQRAIRAFSDPIVTVEGHTDSTGPDTLNDFLSQQRSDAVRQYFIANNAIDEGRILAVGYGSKNPLASNQTVEGRAMNRRIDVLIAPREAGTP